MSDTSPPSRRARRGLSLPPRGQALTRLQDLENPDLENLDLENPDAPDTASSNAVNTAVSNAVNTASSNAVDTAKPQREPTVRITVDMPETLHHFMSLLSAQERRTLKDLVIDALRRTYQAE